MLLELLSMWLLQSYRLKSIDSCSDHYFLQMLVPRSIPAPWVLCQALNSAGFRILLSAVADSQVRSCLL